MKILLVLGATIWQNQCTRNKGVLGSRNINDLSKKFQKRSWKSCMTSIMGWTKWKKRRWNRRQWRKRKSMGHLEVLLNTRRWKRLEQDQEIIMSILTSYHNLRFVRRNTIILVWWINIIFLELELITSVCHLLRRKVITE